MSTEGLREVGELLAEQLPENEPFDVDTLMPTDYLLLEVLAARHRTGEHMWTLPTRAVKPSRLDRLGALGLVGWKHAVVGDAVAAWLTDEGKRACFGEQFVSPVEAQREQARGMIVELEGETAKLAAEAKRLEKRLADQERFNMDSRRSLCALSDEYLARAEEAEAALAVLLDERLKP